MNARFTENIYKCVFLGSALFYAQILWSQALIVYRRDNVAYKHFDNLRGFVVPGVDPKSVTFTSDNGSVNSDRTLVIFSPADTGKVTLTAWVGKKKVGSVEMEVREMTEATVYFGGKKKGPMSAAQFIVQGGLIAGARISEWHEEPIRILSYSVLLIRNNEIIASRTNKGNRFEEETLKFLTTLQPRDVVVFANIQLQSWERRFHANATEFVIE